MIVCRAGLTSQYQVSKSPAIDELVEGDQSRSQ